MEVVAEREREERRRMAHTHTAFLTKAGVKKCAGKEHVN
jgi:hypothetical protein